MRRKDREMNADFAMSIVDKCSFAVLSTVGCEGMPYGVPLSIARIDDTIYFHCAVKGKKTDNLLLNPKVSICCVGDIHIPDGEFTIEYESAIVTGTAKEIYEEEDKIRALDAICRRYTPNNMVNFKSEIERSLKITGIWAIKIESITGKRKKYDQNGVEMKFGRKE